jgi:lysophospholipase L1-like esterase
LDASSDAAPERRLGVLAFGDSITNGGGELQWGVALQSWALWVARGLGLPYTGYALDGARAVDVAGAQIPAFTSREANSGAGYDVGCLYIGVNDVRLVDWDPAAFALAYETALGFLHRRCERVLALTAPLRLGFPEVPVTEVLQLNFVVARVAAAHQALLVDLSGFAARNFVMADRVHPTAFGQVAIAERALAVLDRDGLPTRVAPSSLIRFETTRSGRLRGDLTYTYRSLKQCAKLAAARAGQRRGISRAGGR